MKANESIEPSDYVYELRDISALMAVISDILTDMDYVRVDGSRNEELDKVAALHRIAVDQISHLEAASCRFDRPGNWMATKLEALQ